MVQKGLALSLEQLPDEVRIGWVSGHESQRDVVVWDLQLNTSDFEQVLLTSTYP